MKSKKLILLLIAAIVLFAAISAGLSQQKAAPSIAFTTLKGEQLTLENMRGKVVLVNFWATSCPGCIKEMPELKDTYQKFHAQGFETIAVAMSYDPPNYVLTYVEKNALPFMVTLDMKGEIAQAFGDIKLTPTSFLIDIKGNIIQQVLGEPDFAKLHALIEEKLKEAI
ncbi:peroxiredoxin family protein [Sulfurirhabdus autotrophica]|uniref:Peroxiredoxin n=1 Tax=Sulfurirhabdus autotrophica TaxID=1706046 RepID=A0A4R3YAQ5_9PROT|nr:TlpA disulfide reductase family protein [Sulfurirhabdus autotrophica]TCV88088.1 peroxiredoxin [Sulfurirhabdus autotrophica]